jgi:hypothetical protein
VATSLRHEQVLGKASIPLKADGFQLVTKVEVAPEAVQATATRHVAVDGYPVTNAEPGRLVDGHHLARVLVTWNSGLSRALQVLAICAADGGRFDANYHVPASRLGCGHLIEQNPVLTQKVDC